MRLLHTADLHIGQQLHGYDRREEHIAMLGALTETAVEHKVDAIVVCGDVFDTARPSSQSAAIFAQAMARLRQALPEAAIVVTAGNHDSGAFIESHAPIYRELGITLKGNLTPDNLDNHIISVVGKGVIAALPYTYSALIPQGFARTVIARAAEMAQGLPVVAMAHTTVLGSDPTGHQCPAMGRFDIGNIDGIDIVEFGDDYDYLALGHIHKPQYVDRGARARYSGAPLPVSFDERFEHSFSIVDIAARGAEPQITVVPFASPRPALNIPARGFGEWEEVKRAFSRIDPDFQGYVRLNVTVDGFLPPEARDEAERIASGKSCRFCLINARRRQVEGDRDEAATVSVEEFRALPVMEIARRYAEGIGARLDEELLAEIINTLPQP